MCRRAERPTASAAAIAGLACATRRAEYRHATRPAAVPAVNASRMRTRSGMTSERSVRSNVFALDHRGRNVIKSSTAAPVRGELAPDRRGIQLNRTVIEAPSAATERRDVLGQARAECRERVRLSCRWFGLHPAGKTRPMSAKTAAALHTDRATHSVKFAGESFVNSSVFEALSRAGFVARSCVYAIVGVTRARRRRQDHEPAGCLSHRGAPAVRRIAARPRARKAAHACATNAVSDTPRVTSRP